MTLRPAAPQRAWPPGADGASRRAVSSAPPPPTPTRWAAALIGSDRPRISTKPDAEIVPRSDEVANSFMSAPRAALDRRPADAQPRGRPVAPGRPASARRRASVAALDVLAVAGDVVERVGVDLVLARAAAHRVGDAVADAQVVAPSPRVDRVDAEPGLDDVRARATVDLVVAVTAVDLVVAAARADDVVAVPPASESAPPAVNLSAPVPPSTASGMSTVAIRTSSRSPRSMRTRWRPRRGQKTWIEPGARVVGDVAGAHGPGSRPASTVGSRTRCSRPSA